MKIILASKSPRRQELLKKLGIIDFDIIPASGEEKTFSLFSPEKRVCAIALAKAREVAERQNENTVIIAADTLVFLDGIALGKPKDKHEASQMLKMLSGRKHTVMTGIAVVYNGNEISECESTDVFFRNITDYEISQYIETGEPMDKAGAYGIQELGAKFIPRIEGDYFNVVGLPICRLYSMLQKIGIFNIRR